MATTDVDVSERVRRLVGGGGRTVDEGGPWMRLRAAAVDEAASGGRAPGPLHGLVLGVKDLVAVEGLPLGAGSLTRADAAPEPRDAPVVARLRQAGAVVAGTVALHELAFGVTGVNDRVGFPPNPHDPGRVPGGSSSGSAVAVAAGECDLAVGTDTGGSVRIPAAL
jgi:Asp-tRNA(Asn)/Glu-tRNA(Gln) amidotransferase A subunit family amidase